MTYHLNWPSIVRGDDGWKWRPRFYFNQSEPTYSYWTPRRYRHEWEQVKVTIKCQRIEFSLGFIWGTWGFWPLRWWRKNA